MGYAWNGVCYQDTAAALAAFAKSVPSSDATGINAFSAPPTIDGSGVITWAIVNHPFGGLGVPVTRSGTVQLQACADALDQWPVQSIVFLLALFFAAFMGFKTGYRP